MDDYIKSEDVARRRVLYIDMAYTYKMVLQRELEQELLSRECDGYFEHVWGVHPIADIPEGRKNEYKGFKIFQKAFSPHQTLIEGESAYYKFLKKIFPLNFLVSQLRFTIFLIRLVKREHISIIITTDPFLSGLMGLTIKIFTKAKLVVWVIANYDAIYKATGLLTMPRLFKRRWVEKIFEKLIFRNADLVAGGNQNNLEFALNNGATLEKSTVFPVGKLIHKQHLLAPELRDLDRCFIDSKFIYNFIYVGRLTALKHPDDVIRAFAVIDGKIQGCRLIMAGDGPMREELNQLMIELQLTNRVEFLGNVDQLRLANVLASCFAVLSPLTGRSLIECSLARLPIVAYDMDWQPEFINRQGAGIIVPFKDWQKMGEAALHLIQHPEETKRMAEASRLTGMDAADTEKMYKHEQDEFDKLLRRNAQSKNYC